MAFELRTKHGYNMYDKGQSGNSKGRPKKGKTFTDILSHELDIISQELKDKQGNERQVDGKTLLCLGLIKLAFHSDDDHIKLSAIEKVMNRIDGTPVQQVLMDASVEEHNSVFDEIDVSKLSTKQKENLEEILKNMYK